VLLVRLFELCQMVQTLKAWLVLFRFFCRGLVAFKPYRAGHFTKLFRWVLALKQDGGASISLDQKCEPRGFEALVSFVRDTESVQPCFVSSPEAKRGWGRQRRGSCRVVIRLDCDNGDVHAASKVIDIFRKGGVNLSVHILVDDVEYDASVFKDIVRSDIPHCEFGLHSACWTNPEPERILISEVEKFKALFGIEPESVSLHGDLRRSKSSLFYRSMFVRKWNLQNPTLKVHHGFHWTCQDSRISETSRRPCVTAERLKPLLLPNTIGNIVIHNNYVRHLERRWIC